MLPIELYYAFAFACSVYAGIKGAAPERIGAAVILVGSALTTAGMSGPSSRYAYVESGALLVDGAALLAFLFLSMRAERFWPLWVAAFQLIATAGHAVKLLEPGLIRAAYAIVMGLWTYPVLLIIVFGAWNHQKRLKRFGVDKSWSSSSLPSGPRPPAGPIS